MLTSIRWRIATIAAAVVASGLILPGVAAAAPPSNDDFGAATTVSAVPFTTQADTTEATRASDDPYWCQYHAIGGTVWFSYTPTEDVTLRATTVGSDHGTILSAYTGMRGDLSAVTNACRSSSMAGTTIFFQAEAGTTYHVMVAGYYTSGGALSFDLREVAPPSNDDFADAEPITGLPSTREVDLAAASVEYDEPPRFGSCSGEVSRSTWYAYTATETKSLVAKVGEPYEASVSVFTGNSLPDLSGIGCASGWYSQRVLFRATAGTTYYLRVGGTNHIDSVTLSLTEALPLRPEIGFSPYEPAIYETVHFSGSSGEYDTPIASGEWDFGDGTVIPVPADGATVTHRYTADGTYQVRLSIVSADGRTGTRTATATVVTRDVSISRFTPPSRARAGETKEIEVRVGNTRYRESVTTELYRSNGAYWELVGTLTLDVPASAERTVRFPFSYTFTAADAVTGKVNFRAVVRLPYPERDARPLDNEMISSGTTVLPA